MWYPPLKKAKGAVSGRGYYEVRYGTAANALYGVTDLVCLPRLRDRDAAGHRPAASARRFVRDARSGMRLPESGSRPHFQPAACHFARLERIA